MGESKEMKLKTIARNMTEIEADGVRVLFSYQTPVACHIEGVGYFKTDKGWSPTTSRHIGKWLGPWKPMFAQQEFFDNLLVGGDGVKAITRVGA